MPESAPRNTSESTSEIPIIATAPAALQLEQLDRVVGYDAHIAEQFEHETDQTDYDAYREHKIDELLAENGIIDGDDEQVHAQYVLAKEIYERVIMLTEDEWLTREDGAAVPRRNMVFRQILAEYPYQVSQSTHEDSTDNDDVDSEGDTASTDEASEEDDSTSAEEDGGTSGRTHEQYEELAADYEQYADLLTSREKWAEASAKQQGRAFSLKSKERNTIRDDYHAKVREFGIAELEGQISDDEDDLSKNTKVIEYLFKEQAKLRELTTEKLQNTKVGRFVKFMNKGNLGVRLLKGFGVGLVVGTGGAVVLGVAGAAAGATVAIGASRFVKGYASNDRHRGMTTAQEEFIDSDRPVQLEGSEGDSLQERFDEAAKVYNESFKEDTKNEQKKRRKALAWGVGSVALGASVGYAVSNVGALGDAKDALHDKFSSWFGGSEPSTDNPMDTNDDAPKVVDRDNDAIPDKDDPFVDTDGDGFDDRNGHALFNPEDISQDARWVEAGEGWYQTFGELGIPQDNWADVLNDAGPKLEAQGWSYFDDASGEWRISHQGRLPNSSLRIIADAAQRDGYTLAS